MRRQTPTIHRSRRADERPGCTRRWELRQSFSISSVPEVRTWVMGSRGGRTQASVHLLPYSHPTLDEPKRAASGSKAVMDRGLRIIACERPGPQ